jgi:hypothetical protein
MRYIILILLCMPIAVLARVNAIANYKLNHATSRRRFLGQLAIWLVIILVIGGSFPVYNAVNGYPLFQSDNFSLFDIAQTTIIVYLIYIINGQRRRIDDINKNMRKLHRELSIKLSAKE